MFYGTTAAGAAPPLPAGAATLTEQQTQTALLAAATGELVAANNRVIKASNTRLFVGDAFSLPAGTYRKVSWTLIPSDPQNPNFAETCRVVINGNSADWNANQSGTYGDSLVTSQIDFEARADMCMMDIVWET